MSAVRRRAQIGRRAGKDLGAVRGGESQADPWKDGAQREAAARHRVMEEGDAWTRRSWTG